MIVRRVMYRWLLPAAVVLPALLFFGWIVFSRDGWALLPTLLIFLPGVFVAEIVLALLVRSRASVRESKAVSWLDVLAFGVWHLLTLLVGWFSSPLFGLTLTLAIVAAIGTLWLVVWELWTEGRRAWTTLAETAARPPSAAAPSGTKPGVAPTIVVQESAQATESAARPFGHR